MNLPATDIQSLTLSMSRVFDAPREKVFQAWTEPGMLTQWMGPKEVDTTAAEVDLTIGGRYMFTMREPDGKLIELGGEYREIDPPSRLVFTWVLDGQSCGGGEGHYVETLVTIDLEDLGNSTRLTLTHEFLPTQASREGHEMGWNGSFDGLEAALA